MHHPSLLEPSPGSQHITIHIMCWWGTTFADAEESTRAIGGQSSDGHICLGHTPEVVLHQLTAYVYFMELLASISAWGVTAGEANRQFKPCPSPSLSPPGISSCKPKAQMALGFLSLSPMLYLAAQTWTCSHLWICLIRSAVALMLYDSFLQPPSSSTSPKPRSCVFDTTE